MKDSYILAIYNGVAENKKLIDIHKQIFKDTINFKKVNGYSPESFKRQAFAYAKMGKKAYDIGIGLGLVGEALLDHVFIALNKTKHMDKMDHQVYEIARQIETREKEKILNQETSIKSMQESGRIMTRDEIGIQENATDKEKEEVVSNHLVWYLVSYHGDCAKDHEPWQGRIYIDENWRSICNAGETEIIENLIQMYQVRTFQWVIGRPVWLITRPNCRHYFKKLYTSTVMKNTVQGLLQKNGMISPVGKRRNLQSIIHDTHASWYTESNMKSIIWQYEQRKALHIKMRNAHPCPAITRAIQKDNLLIKRWKAYKNGNYNIK